MLVDLHNMPRLGVCLLWAQHGNPHHRNTLDAFLNVHGKASPAVVPWCCSKQLGSCWRPPKTSTGPPVAYILCSTCIQASTPLLHVHVTSFAT